MDLKKIITGLDDILHLFIAFLLIVFYIVCTLKFDSWIQMGIILIIFFLLGLDAGYQLGRN